MRNTGKQKHGLPASPIPSDKEEVAAIKQRISAALKDKAVAALRQRISAALREKAEAESQLQEILRAQADARRARALQSIDFLIECTEHSFLDCSDGNAINDYEDNGALRCSRCALVRAKDSQYLEYDINVTLTKASYDS